MGWLSADNPVAWWWALLSLCGVGNVVAWALIARRLSRQPLEPDAGRRTAWVVALSGLYTVGCASRSIIPRADVERFALWDTWWSNVFVGRSIATVAELSFAVQGALVLAFVSSELEFKTGRRVAALLVVLLVTAECFSWYAVITTHFLGNVVEESLWAASYALAGLALWGLSRRATGRLRALTKAAAVGAGLYVAFMVTHDVPMYVQRLAATRDAPLLSLSDGVHDLLTRWVVTHRFEDWGPEMPWLSLYFSVAVWLSLALCLVPLGRDALRRMRS